MPEPTTLRTNKIRRAENGNNTDGSWTKAVTKTVAENVTKTCERPNVKNEKKALNVFKAN